MKTICNSYLQKTLHLSVKEGNYLANRRNEIYFEAGETISKQDSEATHVYVINNGAVVNYIDKKDSKRIVQIVNECTFSALPPMAENTKYLCSTKALVPSLICQIKKEVFYSVILNNKYASKYVLNWYTSYIKRLYDIIMTDFTSNTIGKVAYTLQYLNTVSYPENNIMKHISIKTLEQLAGISQESIRKVLKDFKNNGIVKVNENGIEIKSPDILEKYVKYG